VHDAVEYDGAGRSFDFHDNANRLVQVALRPEAELAKPDKDIIASYLIPFTTIYFNYN